MCTDTHPNGEPVWIIEEQPKAPKEAADYDQAIAATGYGLYNILLLLAALPIAWTCLIDTTSTAFIMNSSECDFELTMFRRGIACSAIFIGMMIIGPLWDFFLQDWILGHFGKRNVIVIGILLDAICNILWANTTSFYAFVALKFVSGLLIAGPLSVLMSYLAEFHAPSYQASFTKWVGFLVMLSNVFAAGGKSKIFEEFFMFILFLRTINETWKNERFFMRYQSSRIFGVIIIDAFEYAHGMAALLLHRADWLNLTINNHLYPTWRIYLLMCGLPSVLGLFTACFLPRSPKCLIAQGKNQEALKQFRRMYSWNHFKTSDDYSVKELIINTKVKTTTKVTCGDKLRVSIKQIKALFSGSNIKDIMSLLFLQFSGMVAFSVLRLWVPPLWVIMNNFRVYTRALYPDDELITMCEMIFPRIKNMDYSACNYTLPEVESAVYTNSTMIAACCAGFGFLFVLLATTKARKITTMLMTVLMCTVGTLAANWMIDIPYMLISVAFVIVASRVTLNTVITYNAQFTPQPLRPTALSVINFTGNSGAAVGNIVFAVIISIDCLSAFMWIGCIALVSTLMPLILIKEPALKAEKPDLEKY